MARLEEQKEGHGRKGGVGQDERQRERDREQSRGTAVEGIPALRRKRGTAADGIIECGEVAGVYEDINGTLPTLETIDGGPKSERGLEGLGCKNG